MKFPRIPMIWTVISVFSLVVLLGFLNTSTQSDGLIPSQEVRVAPTSVPEQTVLAAKFERNREIVEEQKPVEQKETGFDLMLFFKALKMNLPRVPMSLPF